MVMLNPLGTFAESVAAERARMEAMRNRLAEVNFATTSEQSAGAAGTMDAPVSFAESAPIFESPDEPEPVVFTPPADTFAKGRFDTPFNLPQYSQQPATAPAEAAPAPVEQPEVEFPDWESYLDQELQRQGFGFDEQGLVVPPGGLTYEDVIAGVRRIGERYKSEATIFGQQREISDLQRYLDLVEIQNEQRAKAEQMWNRFGGITQQERMNAGLPFVDPRDRFNTPEQREQEFARQREIAEGPSLLDRATGFVTDALPQGAFRLPGSATEAEAGEPTVNLSGMDVFAGQEIPALQRLQQQAGDIGKRINPVFGEFVAESLVPTRPGEVVIAASGAGPAAYRVGKGAASAALKGAIGDVSLDVAGAAGRGAGGAGGAADDVAEAVTAAAPIDPVAKLVGLVKASKKLPGDTEALRTVERTRRAALAQQALGGEGTATERLAAARPALFQEGALPKAGFEAPDVSFDPTEIDALRDRVIRVMRSKPYDTFNTNAALDKVLTGQFDSLQENELLKLERVFGKELVQELQKKQPNNLMRTVIDVAGAPRSILASSDLSASFRQLMVGGPGHPKEWGKAMKAQVEALTSEESARAIDDAIRASPMFDTGQSAGLYIAPIDTAVLSAREESIFSRAFSNAPVIRQTQRAYVTALNKFRQEVFDTYTTKWAAEGRLTPARAKSLATYINATTGRGNLGKFEALAPDLAIPFFSPRFLVSRPQILAQLFTPGTDNAVRMLIARDLASFMATGSTVLGLATLVGAEVELDPRSTDFGKMKVGNTRIDPWAGYQQLVRYTAQMASGERKLDGGGFQDQDSLNTFLRFFRSKASPAAGTAFNALSGESMIGEDFWDSLGKTPTDRESFFWQNFMPLFIQDVRDGLAEEGVRGGLLGSLSFFGLSANSYDTPAGKMRGAFKELTGRNYDDLLEHERRPIIENDQTLSKLMQQSEAGRRGAGAEITQKKYEGLASISGLAETDPAAYRAAAGDIVSAAAIARQQAIADGAIEEVRGGQSSAWKAVDGYWNAISLARDPTTRQTDYDQQDRLAAQYLNTLPPVQRQRVINEISYSKDPTYREYIGARSRLEPMFEAEDQAFAQFQKQVAGRAQAGSIESRAAEFETYDQFADFVYGEALAAAQAAAQQGIIPRETVAYEARGKAAKWMRDHKMDEARQYYRAKVIFENPALMDDLRKWYPEQVAAYLLEAESKGRQK